MFRKSTRPLAPRKTLTDLAYARLRDDILNGVIKPGATLSTAQVASGMRISAMPVRAALTRLEAEGLVVVEPQRGVRVAKISSTDLADLFAIRSRLEGLAIYLACPRTTETDLSKLRRCFETLRRSEKAGDTKAWLKANEQFHQVIFELSHNRRLVRLLRDVWNQARRARFATRNVSGHTVRRNQEHERILKAVEAKDANLAESLLREHVFSAGKEIIEFIAEQQGAPIG